MKQDNQLSQSAKKWNEETDLDRWEKHYYEDNYNGNRLRAREKRVLEFLDSLKLPRKAKILELGYGAGVTSAKIYGRGFDLIGVDISTKLKELAIKNCERFKNKNRATFEFRVGNAEKLEFPDNSFDGVIGLGFLHYLGQPLSCLREVKRVLKPKGYFIITQRNMYGISSLDGPLKLMRTFYYWLSNRKYELRWQDTILFYPLLWWASLTSGISGKMKKLEGNLKQHKRIGRVRKRLISFNRLKKMIQKVELDIIKEGGAGYLTKKSRIFPKTAKRIDNYLQEISNKRRKSAIHKVGNSVVFMAEKN